MNPRRSKQRDSWLRAMFGRRLPLEQETAWFLLASLLDYFMTYLVLFHSHSQQGILRYALIESNPVARYFINGWGIVKGMLCFKLMVVLTVCIATQLIAHKRPRTARWVLNFGTAVTSCVVVYSLSLLLRALI